MDFTDDFGCDCCCVDPTAVEVYTPDDVYVPAPAAPLPDPTDVLVPDPSLEPTAFDPAITDAIAPSTTPELLIPGISSPALDDDPYEPYVYDSSSRDSDNDGEVDAFDSDPTIPYNDPSIDTDYDGESDAFDSDPTTAFSDPTRDADSDMEPDAFDSAPTNSYVDTGIDPLD
jgi:hypothetical protein